MAEKRTADGIIDKEDPQDMTVNVTLRYLSKEQVNIKKEITLENSCTAGELSARIIHEEEEKEGIRFSGANIAMVVNGRLAAPEQSLEDGDEMLILPVAAGG